jgi:acyl-coenzyme A thioesterase PaaI-like protein
MKTFASVLVINFIRIIKLRRMRWAGHVARIGQRRDVHRVLVGKPEEKRPVGRRRHTWDVNMKVGVQKVEWFAWTILIWIRIRDSWRALVNAVMNLLIP